jgi:cellulose synthase/poly-beta-1,6-N-acetylglucosamine synthase-like glycosyltransferase
LTTIVTLVLSVGAALAALPAAVIAVQCLAASLPRRARRPAAGAWRPRAAVLVPAHDEETTLPASLPAIIAQLAPDDRLVVVADNCTDASARIAAEHGAEVVVRDDPSRRGKGFALRAGLAHLAPDPPEVVIVVDADCRLEPGCLDLLVKETARRSRPVQGRYVMTAPRESRAAHSISAFAVLVKNRVRPLAMSRLGLPCLLTGSGSAFPWSALQAQTFEGDHLVEDMKLAVDLALAGFPPAFCDEARLSASLPERPAASLSQRRRWEHGHLETLIEQGPRLARAFLRTRNLALAAMMFDLCVPPLSLLALVLSASLAAGGGWWLATGRGWPLWIATTGVVLLAGGLMLAWARFARGELSLVKLLSAPAYVATKVPVYGGFVTARQRAWVRTDRGEAASPSEGGEPRPLPDAGGRTGGLRR